MGPVSHKKQFQTHFETKREVPDAFAFLVAAAVAEETKVAEVTDQQVEASRYGYYGGYHGGYGHGYGHGYRYGRSVADVEGQESHYGGYHGGYGHGYGHVYGHGHRYGRSIADVEGQESHYGGYYPRYGGYRYGHYYH